MNEENNLTGSLEISGSLDSAVAGSLDSPTTGSLNSGNLDTGSFELQQLIETPTPEETIDLSKKVKRSRKLIQAQGLGDVIENITAVLGIDECPECEERKRRLNKLSQNYFPWMKNEIRTLTEEELDLMSRINGYPMLTYGDRVSLFNLYNSLFETNQQSCNCPGLIQRIIKRINEAADLTNNYI